MVCQVPKFLEVHDLTTQYFTGGGIVHAVDGVSFDLAEGETLGLVGESGCGKSATALSLMRLVPKRIGHVQGQVWFDGDDLLELDDDRIRRLRGRKIAIIFQDPMTSLNPSLTVGRQITEALQLHLAMTRSDARQRAIELLEHVSIPSASSRLGDYPHQFSGGMRQRVMIAIAVSCNPKLIIADEPTTALDVTVQAQILDLLRTLARELETAFILITHDLGVVAGMTERVHVMYAGQIVEKAGTSELFARPRHPYTWGLLRSIPRMGAPSRRKLVPIGGTPPDLVSPPAGCRFAPRCEYRRAICSTSSPELANPAGATSEHVSRCHAVQPGGWLTDVDWRETPDGRASSQ